VKSTLLDVLLLQSKVTDAQLKLIGDELTEYEFPESVKLCPIPTLAKSINPRIIYKILFFNAIKILYLFLIYIDIIP
jgi:hypothetical protein